MISLILSILLYPITVSWTPPTMDIYHQPLPNLPIDNYKIYIKTLSTSRIRIISTGSTSYLVNKLRYGTKYEIWVTAIENGLESAPSNVIPVVRSR